jgi:hypothetical protein
VDADAELDAALWGKPSIALDHSVLHLEGATHSIDDATELNDRAVACALDDASMVHGDDRID